MIWKPFSAKEFLGVFVFLIFFCILFNFQNTKYEFEKNIFFAPNIPGESIFLSLKSGHTVVIDGGLFSDAEKKLHQQMPFWEKEIDLLFLTHADQDHAEGVKNILKNFRVKNLVLSGAHHNNPLFLDIITLAYTHNTTVIFAEKNVDFQLENIKIDTLFPEKSIGKMGKTNNSSVVFRVFSPEKNIKLPHDKGGEGGSMKKTLLFTGDIEKNTEKEILKTPVKLVSDILKVAHHGSKTSSSEYFLQAVQPETAVIIANTNNPFGHPHEKIVKQIEEFAKNILVTGEVGDVEMEF